MPVTHLKAILTSSEKEGWLLFFKNKHKKFDRMNWYSAQICWQIYLLRCLWNGQKPSLQVKDFVLEFEVKEQEFSKMNNAASEQKQLEEIDRHKKIQKSKGAWFSFLQIDSQ